MANVQVPAVQVKVFVDGGEIARFDFYRTERSTQDWEITAAIIDRDCTTAVRACLLASISELTAEGWDTYTFEAEGGSETNDQPQLPWE